jgi:hypothetical protein
MRRLSTLHPNHLIFKAWKHRQVWARTVRLVVKSDSEKAPGADAHHTYPDTHDCICEEGTRGVCDDLLKGDSRHLIRTYQANSLTHRPDHPKAGPPRGFEWGGKSRYR